MSDAPTQTVVSPPSDPDRRDPAPATPAVLPRVSSLLRAVRLLVDYGTALIATLQQRSCLGRCATTMMTFGTRDLALIIARITCGLQRAAALEERLNRLVARGVDLPVPSVRPLAAGPSATRAAGTTEMSPARAALLEALPSVEEIAEQVRTQSLGVIIADICRDLGLAPGAMDARIWDALSDAALDGGIDLGRLMRAEVPPGFWDLRDDLEFTALICSQPEDEAAAIERLGRGGAARSGAAIEVVARPP